MNYGRPTARQTKRRVEASRDDDSEGDCRRDGRGWVYSKSERMFVGAHDEIEEC
jgi:hypothetical protein